MNPVRITNERGVMTATLADAESRNALGPDLIQGLRDALAAANADPKIRALVVTNEGTTFCAGANLKQRSASKQKASASGGFEELLHEIQTSPTPVIGRIAGHVVGGGNGLAAALDISIAADDVKFGFTEVRLGVAPAIISVVCLPKMRPGEAMEAFLRGHRFSAARAAELGLINRAVARNELDAAVEEVLADLRKGGPRALGFAKRLVHEVPRMTTKDAFQWTSALSGELFAGDEAREGMTAFLQKRDPAWAKSDGD
ncbi:MAG TPA: enoyl-CoA hydratase-related protein [Myxococcota bacterium]|jgi:methylglutaconyl-CoA hydratase